MAKSVKILVESGLGMKTQKSSKLHEQSETKCERCLFGLRRAHFLDENVASKVRRWWGRKEAVFTEH